mgnify:CR=1 FL=1
MKLTKNKLQELMWEVIDEKALSPYMEKKIDQEKAISELMKPIRTFMVSETRKSDLKMFYNLTNEPKPTTPDCWFAMAGSRPSAALR